MKHTDPFLTAARGISTASCGCGWESGLQWGRTTAQLCWAIHVAKTSTPDEKAL